MKVIPQTRGVH